MESLKKNLFSEGGFYISIVEILKFLSIVERNWEAEKRKLLTNLIFAIV